MKFFLVNCFLYAANVQSLAYTTVGPSQTSLFASRSSSKALKRDDWAKSRGMTEGGGSAFANSQSTTNEHGLEIITLTSDRSSVSIYPFGGLVASFKKDNQEFIAIRPDAKLDKSKPISGGLSFCWPQFGPGDETNNGIQQHGFARNVDWAVDSVVANECVLSLQPNDETNAMWGKDFHLTYKVAINADGNLDTTFTVKNVGTEAFNHQAALHSYYKVSDLTAGNLKIGGSFKGAKFLNKVLGEEQTEERDEIVITEETDSVYMGVNDPSLSDSGTKKKLNIVNEGWKDTVLWSPWGSEAMGFNEFVCVESVLFDNTEVPAGGEWVGKMSLQPENID